MSLQMSYPQNAKDHVAAAIDVSSIDGRQLPSSRRSPRSAEEAMTLSLVHLDVALAIEPPAPNVRGSADGEPSFKVSAKRLARASAEADPEMGAEEVTDPVMQRLSDALAATRAMHNPHSAILVDALRLAMLTRKASGRTLLGQGQSELAESDREGQACRTVRSLQKWRLKRVMQYIDDNLDAKVTLQHLAAVAGLSRMHFAAQFRAAVGMRPHDYLLKRRIERAQELLQRADTSLVDIALTVGFQTQAHFTTVFKRFAGNTPYQWRSAHLAQFLPLPRIEARPS
ncbi:MULTISPECIES: helix-turn-helix domain-containing protein [Bradyrhizobium]|uniref:AraC family transcriptional regulator n=1 Tax=Bradyrhizobium arachidis TaxID=858423 RepID=A0AAE7NPS4_9BRAD|nr:MULTISPECIES: AraC family transcriptional regulator [Bradyrhizobium]QOG20719.1 helix-turn-helix domain-containing protein [Bradyrhizobium sp. SEMIA]QOZ68131.1 AraC family transcriptional regulator [Bradyrhizobium arachidis]UFW52799.1 AraC family transcriptional regulator [Bradyrhizobium arachidis]SFV12796.1 AraC-type DNA-binding protein [Bradyrhizobium arachidis]